MRPEVSNIYAPRNKHGPGDLLFSFACVCSNHPRNISYVDLETFKPLLKLFHSVFVVEQSGILFWNRFHDPFYHISPPHSGSFFIPLKLLLSF